MNKTVTRKELQGYGLSNYQAITLTKTLPSVSQGRRSKSFALTAVIEAIRNRLDNARLKATTRNAMNKALGQLTARLGNVLSVPFTLSDNPEIQKAGTQLLKAIAKTDSALADLQADAAVIQAKYQVAL